MQLTVRQPSASEDAKHYTTDRLRSEYLIETVFAPDDAILTYSHFDRIIAGGVMPVNKSVELVGCKELASDTFLQRREMGVINIGGKGKITVDGTVYDLKQYDGLYVGMGAKELSFTSDDPADPAKFYINTCPAHKTYPTVKIDIDKANKRPLGSVETCNKRVINQYIHPAVMQSCQLCMGMTQLAPGSNWNSMPCHTHERRMEVYFYFDLKATCSCTTSRPSSPRPGRSTPAWARATTPSSGACAARIRNLTTWTTSIRWICGNL